MDERPSGWRGELLIAIVISLSVLGILIAAAWLAQRTDHALGTGPLPSNLSGREAYVLTVFTALLGVIAGAATVTGASAIRTATKRFPWIYWVLVVLPGALIVITPLSTFGNAPWGGLPPFLVSVPAHVVISVALGGALLGGLDILQWVPGKRFNRRISLRPGAVETQASPRGLPGRFTPSAWRTLASMQEEARRFEQGYMGPEHLLLGLLREDRSVAARVLINMSIDLDGLRVQVEGIIGRRGSLFTGSGGLTRRCQQVIEQAARLARESSEGQVGTGHLLWSFVTNPDDSAGQSLVEKGVTPDRVAAEIKRLGNVSGEMASRGGPTDD